MEPRPSASCFLLALAFAAVATGCSRKSSPSSPGSQLASRSIVQGTVQAAGGGPIAGANLTLTGSPAGTTVAQVRGATGYSVGHHDLRATSDATGHFDFESAYAGNYVLTTSATGFESNVVPLTIPETGHPQAVDTTTVSVTLTPLPPGEAP